MSISADYSQQSLAQYLPKYKSSLEISSSSLENQYLDQFFQKNGEANENQIVVQIKENSEIIKNNDKKIQETLFKKEPRIKSKFHNFQKHLIITLKKSVGIPKEVILREDAPVQELWREFCQKRTYNKSLLRILFGENMIEEQLNKKLFKKEGFKSIIDRYPTDQIIEAQHSLRKIVVDNFERIHLDDVLEARKIPDKTKELFKKYIVEFITELKQGHVMKRLPKCKKAQIISSD